MAGRATSPSATPSGSSASWRQNPSKAAAWAGVLGIPDNQDLQLRRRADTGACCAPTRESTNHGYVDGHATTLQSVLESGTAVLVDPYGRPTVKCYCGNPLTPPVLYASPTYTGTPWPGFSSSSITIIQRSTTIINQVHPVRPEHRAAVPAVSWDQRQAGALSWHHDDHRHHSCADNEHAVDAQLPTDREPIGLAVAEPGHRGLQPCRSRLPGSPPTSTWRSTSAARRWHGPPLDAERFERERQLHIPERRRLADGQPTRSR